MFRRYVMAFAPDEAGGGQASDSGDAAAGQKSGDTGSQNNQQVQQGSGTQTNQANAGQNTQVPMVSMPQSSFNDRLAQERAAGIRALLQELGFEQVQTPEGLAQAQTAMRDLLTFARQQQEAQMTADQKVQASLEAATQRAAKAETQVTTLTAERDTARDQLRSYVLRAQIVAAATGASYPDDVFNWAVQNQPDSMTAVLKTDQPLFNADGTLNAAAIDQDAIKKIVSACAQARPTWFRHPGHGGSPSNGSAQPPRQAPAAASDLDRKKAAARKAARI